MNFIFSTSFSRLTTRRHQLSNQHSYSTWIQLKPNQTRCIRPKPGMPTSATWTVKWRTRVWRRPKTSTMLAHATKTAKWKPPRAKASAYGAVWCALNQRRKDGKRRQSKTSALWMLMATVRRRRIAREINVFVSSVVLFTFLFHALAVLFSSKLALDNYKNSYLPTTILSFIFLLWSVVSFSCIFLQTSPGALSLREVVDGAHVLGMNENTARDWYFSLPKNEDHEVDMEMIIEKFLERPAGLEKSAYALDHRGYTQVYYCVHVCVYVYLRFLHICFYLSLSSRSACSLLFLFCTFFLVVCFTIPSSQLYELSYLIFLWLLY